MNREAGKMTCGLRRAAIAIAILACVGCAKPATGEVDSTDAPPATAPIPVTSLVVITTTTAPVPPEQVSDCVEYTQFAAYIGDEEMLEFWNAAAQDVATLRSNCERLGVADPMRLASFSSRKEAADAYIAAAAATTAPPTLPPPTSPPPTAPPVTAPPRTSPPATQPPPVVQPVAETCDPNYSGGCVPIASDVDCAGGSGNGPAYFSGTAQVVGSDVYDLDRDGNGVACQS